MATKVTKLNKYLSIISTIIMFVFLAVGILKDEHAMAVFWLMMIIWKAEGKNYSFKKGHK